MASTMSVQMAPEGNLSRYLQDIRKFPMLAPDEEQALAKRWRDHGDEPAAHKLVTSHLRLVAKIAMGYRGYGLPIGELISEGNVGMMQAVKRFDPERGFRLATYAMWWIRAAIQEYILHSWSLVKMGTTAAQKKLFFNLRRLKGQMQVEEQFLLRRRGAHLHQGPAMQDVFLDRGPDPPHGVGGQAEAAIGIEALHRLHHADIAFADQLANRQAVAAIAHGDFRNEAQM